MASIQAACDEINSGYAETQKIFRKLKYKLSVQLIHIEAYAALINHKRADPLKHVPVLDAADHVGFDYYGDFDDCAGL